MWVHRVPVAQADDRWVEITDSQGHTCRVMVRLESDNGCRNINVCVLDPCRNFILTPRSKQKLTHA